MPFVLCGRLDIMPSRIVPWAFACSTALRSVPATRSRHTGSPASRSSIFDVHHGNGTQAAFARDASVQYLSTHQWPLYPGTGARSETGVGNIVNRPLPAGTGSEPWRAVVEADILPAIDRFAPELIMVSAGFDAHQRDPLAMLELVEDDFGWVTDELMKLADRHAKGRLVSVLEGGYDLTALANSCMAHLNALRST